MKITVQPASLGGTISTEKGATPAKSTGGVMEQKSTLSSLKNKAAKPGIFAKMGGAISWVFTSILNGIAWPFRKVYYCFCGKKKVADTKNTLLLTSPPTPRLKALLDNPTGGAKAFIADKVAYAGNLIDEFLTSPIRFLKLIEENPKDFNQFSKAIAANEEAHKFLEGESNLLEGICQFIDTMAFVRKAGETDSNSGSKIREAFISHLQTPITIFAKEALENLKEKRADDPKEFLKEAHKDLEEIFTDLLPVLAGACNEKPDAFFDLIVRLQKQINEGSFSKEKEYEALFIDHPADLPEALTEHPVYQKIQENAWLKCLLLSLFTEENKKNFGIKGVDLSIAFKKAQEAFMKDEAGAFIKQVREEILVGYQLAEIFCQNLESRLKDPAYRKNFLSNFTEIKDGFKKARTAIHEAP